MSQIKVGDMGWALDGTPATVTKIRWNGTQVWYVFKDGETSWCTPEAWLERLAKRPIEVAATETECNPEYTGGSVDYYQVTIKNPTTEGRPEYIAECNDIIEALGMNFAEGNAFKALWRRASQRTLGKVKAGAKSDGLYDAEKVAFFGQRLIEQSKAVK